MDEFLKIIFGDFTLVQLLGYTWFFIIGYFIYGLTEVTGRNTASPNTPKEWSWKFWFLDNWKRYLTTILCSYVFFRFYNEISGHPFGNIDAVTLGMIGDGLSVTIKGRVKSFAADREKLMIQMKKTDETKKENI